MIPLNRLASNFTMSQPLFDPLDAVVLTRGLVPWADSVLAAEAGYRRQEMLQRTSEQDAWTWTSIGAPAELDLPAREARSESPTGLVNAWIARFSAFLHGSTLATKADLAHGERA